MSITEEYVRGIFTFLKCSDWEEFYKSCIEKFEWTCINSEIKSTEFSGKYIGVEDLYNRTGEAFNKYFKTCHTYEIKNIIVSGNTAVVEMIGTIHGKNGKTAKGPWCFICEFEQPSSEDDKPLIKIIREYQDSALLKSFFHEES